MLQHVSEFPAFLRLNNIPLYVYTTFCLSIHPLFFITLKHDLPLAPLAATKGIVFPDLSSNKYEEFGK